MDFLDKMAAKQPTNTDLQIQRERQNQAAPVECPIGAMLAFAGTSDSPDGRWLICDGRLLKQDDYPDLYLVVSTNFNIGGETAGQFRIPDTRGRTIVGSGSGAGLTTRVVGAKFGEETHLLTVNEMPTHNHPVSTYTHNHYNTPDQAGLDRWSFGFQNVGAADAAGNWNVLGSSTGTRHYVTTWDSHYHNIDNAGLSVAHNNIQPSLAVPSIIRAF
jgi:microcystin-dependent protein